MADPLSELATVMRRLRAECPWKQEQTHRSLARYLLEELHETLEAIDTGDPAHLREELGDLLLQVYFHAVIAEESGAFTLDEVAAGITDKMVRRNPHVFGESGPAGPPGDAAAVNEVWEQVKAAEKQRDSVTDGLPPALPALLYADKVLDRLARRDGHTPFAPPVLLLVASPFLGPASWAPVAWWLRGRGLEVEIVDTGETTSPVDLVDVVVAAAAGRPVVLVPHSNAGLYAAQLSTLLDVRAVVYVDAALPEAATSDGGTAVASEALRAHLATRVDDAGRLPPWSTWWPVDQLASVLPDPAQRAALSAQERRLPAAYLAERVPVPAGWIAGAAAYLAFGDTYAPEVDAAESWGWPTLVLEGGHLHTLVDPCAVGAAIEDLLGRLESSQSDSSQLGDRLLALVAEARAGGVDPEQALRDAVRRLLDARGSETTTADPA